MNRIELVGRLTADPTLLYTQNTQTPVCKFNLAVDRIRRQGEEQKTDFFRVTAFRSAETHSRFLKKGRLVALSGTVQTGQYKKDGVTVYTTDVIADEIQYLPSGLGSKQTAQSQSAERQATSGNSNAEKDNQGVANFDGDDPFAFSGFEVDGNDIPF